MVGLQVRLLRCYEVVQEVVLMRSGAAKLVASPSVSSSVPQSPNGVLDAACCMSYKSEDIIVVGSHANSHHSSPPASKRRKMSRPTVL